ncbi:hypothetical protein SV7mr_38930 [Stieleria bergensis]|uniref:Thioredoxin-like fold domain-containing protein n=2 Tax=Stieleria bergensis TaxID=2528025 RepID=A0A517SYY3_9BACT|nr:hypothetical protein SV7mr_38930 [Planctomycetes bacterium SV_7m_r]
MLTIKILGPGCPNCRQLEQLTLKAVDELGVEAEVSKLTDPLQCVEHEVMATPGLVIDDKTVCSGRVPSLSELKDLINAAFVAR